MEPTNKFYCNGKKTVYVKFPIKPIRLEVYNDNGKVYYFRELGGKFDSIKFNICHKGHYTLSENCIIDKIVDIEIYPIKVQLPAPDRNRMKPVKVVYNDSLILTPARIFSKQGVIEVGRKFKTFPFPIRLFILCHEEGHLLYADEFNADLYACKIYVDNGYNKSNALYALTKILKGGKRNTERILKLFKTLQS